jgi:hypothetical protein
MGSFSAVFVLALYSSAKYNDIELHCLFKVKRVGLAYICMVSP